jgi:hypothetical protein
MEELVHVRPPRLRGCRGSARTSTQLSNAAGNQSTDRSLSPTCMRVVESDTSGLPQQPTSNRGGQDTIDRSSALCLCPARSSGHAALSRTAACSPDTTAYTLVMATRCPLFRPLQPCPPFVRSSQRKEQGRAWQWRADSTSTKSPHTSVRRDREQATMNRQSWTEIMQGRRAAHRSKTIGQRSKRGSSPPAPSPKIAGPAQPALSDLVRA